VNPLVVGSSPTGPTNIARGSGLEHVEHMPTQAKLLLSVAGLSLLLATIAGAVGSHALPLADEQARRSFETAVQFQFFHGLGVVAIAIVGLTGRAGFIRGLAAWLMLAGTVLFCGSIYARSLGASPGIVGVAPYGGVAFMVAWLAFAVSPWFPERGA
jgi:uncharacterized membrane protein YgdD (TMEM256/DUF423 family)